MIKFYLRSNVLRKEKQKFVNYAKIIYIFIEYQ